MTDTDPRFGVAHPTVVPDDHRQRRDTEGRDAGARPDHTGEAWVGAVSPRCAEGNRFYSRPDYEE